MVDSLEIVFTGLGGTRYAEQGYVSRGHRLIVQGMFIMTKYGFYCLS